MVGAKVCELTDGFLWFVCGLYVGILTSPLVSEVTLIRLKARIILIMRNVACIRGTSSCEVAQINQQLGLFLQRESLA